MTPADGSLRTFLHQHWWIAPLALILAAGGGWGAASLAKPVYVRWRSARALSQARGFLGTGDLNRADLALQVALRGGPSLQGYELLGDLFEAAGSSQAVAARRLAAQMKPGDPKLELDLARTALRFDDLAAARAALDSIAPAGRTDLQFVRAEATYAMLAGEWPRSARLLADIERRQPDDPGVRLIRDALNLRNADPGIAADARADLRRLAAGPGERRPALRVLLADALVRREPLSAGEFGRALAADPGSSFSDLLAAATAESFAFPASGLDAALESRIRSAAGADPAAAAQFGRWLLLHRGPEPAAAWLRQLPPRMASDAAEAELRAEVSAARGDWGSLRRDLERGDWGSVLAPAVEFGFAARILRQRGAAALAGRTWSAALAEGSLSEPTLRALVRLADLWRWPDAMQDALFATVRDFPGDEVAAQQLIGLLRARGESRDLLELFALRRDAQPGSARRAADWAVLSLLVSPTAQPDLATQTLDRLYERQPDNPFIATDHAFALWELGRFAAAEAVLGRMSADDRQIPARAPYLAVIYASAGMRGEARAALVRAPSPRSLLPEEAALIARADALVLR
jgi:hypothetical protein